MLIILCHGLTHKTATTTWQPLNSPLPFPPSEMERTNGQKVKLVGWDKDNKENINTNSTATTNNDSNYDNHEYAKKLYTLHFFSPPSD